MSNWYLVHTKIRQERIALENLQRQGFECFLPEVSVEKLRRGKLVVLREPLFSRYLFIRLESGVDAPSWSPIRSTVGVQRLVTFGQVPAKVHEDLIKSIRLKSESPELLVRVFTQGDQVLVTGGPFVGLEAIFQTTDAEGRAILLLTMLSKPVKLTLESNSIRRSY